MSAPETHLWWPEGRLNWCGAPALETRSTPDRTLATCETCLQVHEGALRRAVGCAPSRIAQEAQVYMAAEAKLREALDLVPATWGLRETIQVAIKEAAAHLRTHQAAEADRVQRLLREATEETGGGQ